MLIRPNDIFQVDPPFLILFGNGQWKVASRLLPHPDGIGYQEPFSTIAEVDQPHGVVSGNPWHVGDDVWEMDYNTQIMTLDHSNFHSHPAWRLWLHWLMVQSENESQITH